MEFIAVAGVPHSLADLFAEVRVRRLGDDGNSRHLIWAPVSDAAPHYTGEYVERLHASLWEAIVRSFPSRALSNGDRVDATAVLVYVDYPNDRAGIDALKRSFLPSVLPFAAPHVDTVSLKHMSRSQRQGKRNTLVDGIDRAIKKSRKVLPALEKEVSSRANRTCLLLPTYHFRVRTQLAHHAIAAAR